MNVASEALLYTFHGGLSESGLSTLEQTSLFAGRARSEGARAVSDTRKRRQWLRSSFRASVHSEFAQRLELSGVRHPRVARRVGSLRRPAHTHAGMKLSLD